MLDPGGITQGSQEYIRLVLWRRKILVGLDLGTVIAKPGECVNGAGYSPAANPRIA